VLSLYHAKERGEERFDAVPRAAAAGREDQNTNQMGLGLARILIFPSCRQAGPDSAGRPRRIDRIIAISAISALIVVSVSSVPPR
jgi:hypothetical protein